MKDCCYFDDFDEYDEDTVLDKVMVDFFKTDRDELCRDCPLVLAAEHPENTVTKKQW